MSSGLDLKRDDAPLPSGTVTFVFSDIEGSTTRWERNREAMREALRRHDVLMRRSIEACGGRVFKTMGDAFFAVFTRPEDGARAALDAQRALAAEDFSAVDGLRVRMALHSGSSDERDSDYFGPAVNRAARLLAVAHGGQILSSRAVAEHLRNALPPIELRDLGAHRLKDLIEPEYVFQLGAPGLAADFPPLLSLSVLDNNLPQQLTNLIGREHELSEIEPLLEQHRLVTLIGAGGVGKTRVALQAGADLLDGSGDGVWFAELAPLRDAALVAETIASALGLTERADTPALDSLLRFLKDRRLLLLFDNCEHLIAEVARIGEAILRECPNVRLLATSREPLHIAGERIYPIQSLAVPPERAGFSATEAARYSAISLFVERATASDPTFVLTDDVASIVGEICRRIDGIPLAIELAASRVRVLAPRQLAKKLDDRFRVLTGGARTALPRQQTMRALIEWSYDLLSRQEQTLFRRLSIFAGGWTLQAASDVCAGDDGSGCEALDEDEVFDLLSALIDKSLVVSEPCIEEQRYRLLESTREYARERLELRETEMTLRKHAVWFADFANRVATLNEMPAGAWLAMVEVEQDNIRAALDWSLTRGRDVALGGDLASSLVRFWRAQPREGRRWLEVAQQRIDPARDPKLAAAVTGALTVVAPRGPERRRLLELAVQRYRAVDDTAGLLQTLRQFADELSFSKHLDEAESVLSEALDLSREQSDKESEARCVSLLATVYAHRGDIEQARRLYGQAIDLHVPFETSAVRAHANMLGNLAELEFAAGEPERAIELAMRSIRLELDHDAQSTELALSHCNLAAYLIGVNRFDEAKAHALDALARLRDEQEPYYLVIALEHLAVIAGLSGDVERAVRLASYTNERLHIMGIERELSERLGYERLLVVLSNRYDGDTLRRLMEGGASLTDGDAIGIAEK